MEQWHIWIIVAIALFIFEVFTLDFFLACLGIGSLFGGLAAALGLGIKTQILIFSIVSLIVFIVIRPFVLRYIFTRHPTVKTNVDALVGATGFVCETVDPGNNTGRVKVAGDDWRAISIDGTVIKEGEQVEIVKVEGTKLFVKQ